MKNSNAAKKKESPASFPHVFINCSRSKCHPSTSSQDIYPLSFFLSELEFFMAIPPAFFNFYTGDLCDSNFVVWIRELDYD